MLRSNKLSYVLGKPPSVNNSLTVTCSSCFLPAMSFDGVLPRRASMLKINFYTYILSVIFMFTFNVTLRAEQRVIRVGVFPAAPLVMINNGKPQGLFIDLVEYFSQTQGWKIEYVDGTWSEHLTKLKNGEIDLLPAVGYTKERTSVYDFSKNPVYIDYGVIFTNPGITLHTIFDLNGKRVAALDGSIFTKGFTDYISTFGIQCEIISTKDNREVMLAIENGSANAGVCIYSLGNELAKEYKVTITPISFSPVALLFAVPKNKNSDLIDCIDSIMPALINDPESLYSLSFRKWTIPQQHSGIPRWLWLGASGLAVLGLFLGFWSMLLRRQVVMKTKHLENEISERKLAEEKIRQSLEEKETLIREIYHRTKNTLQVVRSMIVLQADDYKNNSELQQLVRNTEDRIQAISLVHKMLYRSRDLSHISIKEYIEELAELVMQNFIIFDDRVSLNLNIEDQLYLLDTAIPFGLILNELMTNSLYHAFPDNREGTIDISLEHVDAEKSVLKYSDDGIGVPDGFDFRKSDTLGLKLIHNIGELQLMGKVDFKNENGIRCVIELSTGLYDVRV